MSASEDAKALRNWLERDPHNCTIGGVGCTGDYLRRVLDRLDELEWMMSVMRGLSPELRQLQRNDEQ